MSDRSRRDEPIVELASCGTRFEADALVATLEQHGVQAMAQHGDAGGWAPHVALLDGHRVLVFASEVATAREVLGLDE